MNIRIDILSPDSEDSYESLMRSVDWSMVYTSIRYRRFLKSILEQSQDYYLLAYDGSRLVGALPTFVRYNSLYGNVINSLPFFGSHGGCVVAPDCRDPLSIKQALLKAFDELAEQHHVAAATLIPNPLDPDASFYNRHLSYTIQDERIGQITPLPTSWENDTDLQDKLIGLFQSRTRTKIRKAEKGLVVEHSSSIKDLETLSSIHKENMDMIGGRSKPWPVFEAISRHFEYDADYRVYLAMKEDRVIAALLVFFYNRTAEYFTPATIADYRSDQPGSLLVYHAMQEASRRGCLYWNWGGTWKNQDGVYHFKSHFGARDIPYTYFIRIHNPAIYRATKESLVEEYGYFYVLPYEQLDGSNPA